MSAVLSAVVPYQVFILAMSVAALLMLAAQLFVSVGPETASVLEIADIAVCCVFLFDFLWSLTHAERKWRYLLTWGWIDLLSSIPVFPALRWGRAARVARVLRILRGARAARLVVSAVLEHRRQSAVFAAATLSLVLVFGASIFVLQFETAPESNIRTGGDALWWAFTTITTVGYGDRFPVTAEGRAVAALLMIAGVGMFGTFSGLVASWFLAPKRAADSAELAALRRDVDKLGTTSKH